MYYCFYSITIANGPTINFDHSNCTTDNTYSSGSTSMPGIIAGAVGGLATAVILVTLLIGYLIYSCYAHRLSISIREMDNDITLEHEPPPYQSPMNAEHNRTISTFKYTLSDPPPSYSSLA